MPAVYVYLDPKAVDSDTAHDLPKALESILAKVLELPPGRIRVYPHDTASNAVTLRPIAIEADVSARSNPPEVLKERHAKILAELGQILPKRFVGNGSVSLWLKPVAGEFGTV